MRFFTFLFLFLSLLVVCSKCDFHCSKIERTFTKHAFAPESFLNRMNRRTVFHDFSIRLNKGSGLSSYPAASHSFEIASKIWSEIFKNVHIETPITIDVDLAGLRGGVLGSTRTIDLIGKYCGEEGILPEPLQSAVGIQFPVCQNISYAIPNRIVFRGNMLYCKPNLKALGFTGLDEDFGQSDGSITFSNRFSFDFDLSDGLDPRKTDFLSVVIHEMGHLFGFISGVDDIDTGSLEFTPSILDLYRFEMIGSASHDFLRDQRIANPRIGNHTFWGIVPSPNQYRLSSGTRYGDGNQASHWGADELYEKYVGLMDPSLAAGKSLTITIADILAFKALGYSINAQMKPIVVSHRIEGNTGRTSILKVFAQLMLGDIVMCKFTTRDNHTIQTTGYKDQMFSVCNIANRQDVTTFSVSGDLGNFSDEIQL